VQFFGLSQSLKSFYLNQLKKKQSFFSRKTTYGNLCELRAFKQFRDKIALIVPTYFWKNVKETGVGMENVICMVV